MHVTHQKCFLACSVALCALTATAVAQNEPGRPSQGPAKQQPPPDQARERPQSACPAFVRGAKLSLTNVDQGVQFTITAKKPENADALRKAAREVADFITQNERSAGTSAKETSSDHAPAFPPLDIRVRNVSQGSQVTIKAEQKSDVGEVRQTAQEIERLWQNSRCTNDSSTG